jgi:hypothetical protein
VLANQPDGIATRANLAFPANPSLLTTLTTISLMASVAAPTFVAISVKAQEAHEINDARQVALALKIYASGHGGKYPQRLTDLSGSDALPDVKALEYTDPVTKVQQAWLFNAKLNDSSPATELLLVAPKPLTNGERIGAFNDGSVRKISEEEYQRFNKDK